MPATDLERLVVQLSADIKQYENSLNRARGQTARQARAIENRFAQMNRNISKGVNEAALGFARAFALIGGARGLQTLTDTATRIDNALRIAGQSGEGLERTYQSLFESATRNAAPLEALVQLYGRVSLVQGELGVSSERLLGFTDTVALALRASGQSAQEASGALLQLSQALGGGVVRAEEFNSIQEGAPTILQAAAAGIREAGGSVARLRQIMLNGELSSRAFFEGIQAGAPLLEQRVAGAVRTLDNRLSNLYTALINAAREFNSSARAGETFGNEIDRVAAFVNGLKFDSLIGQIQGVIGAFNSGVEAANGFAQALGRMTGLDNVGRWIAGEGGRREFFGGALTITSTADAERKGFWEEQAERDIRLRNKAYEEVAKDPTLYGPQLPPVAYAASGPLSRGGRRRGTQLNSISISDFPATGSSGSGAGSGRRSGGAGGGRDADSRFNDDIQAVRDRTAALIEEQRIVSLSYQEQEKRRMALDLEQSALAELREEARRKGQTDLDNIQLSGEQRRQIDEASEAYARQADALRRVQEAQDRAERSSEEFYDSFKSSTIGAITGVRSLSDALSEVAKRLGDMLLNSAFDSLFQPTTSSNSGGLFGGLFAGLFREKGGPVRRGQPYIVGEKRPEVFVPDQNGTILPRVPMSAPRMPDLANVAAARQSAAPSITFAPQIDARGASVEAVARLEEAMDRQQRDFAANVLTTMRKARKTRDWQ
ncbi:MAG: tape measure protein [Shinella sp.]|nr:tape measure protein [Shinella sp.]